MTGNTVENRLRAGLERMRVRCADDRVRQLLAYVDLLERWNRTYNLTAVRNSLDMVPKHILDALSVLPWAQGSLLDAGAGAGLPGVPLAIVDSTLDVTLADSAGKKVRFMNHVKRELGLANIHPLQVRVEALEREMPFDTIVSRALASLSSFAMAVRGLAGQHSRLLAMKGQYPEEEIAALPEWVRVQSVEQLAVPGLQENRHLVIMSVIP